MRKPSAPLPRKKGSSEGFSLPIAVLAGFLLLLGSLALASRSSWGLFGSAFQSKNWEARSAAETGMNVIVNELNRPQNRWLSVVRKNNRGDIDPDYSNGASGDLWQNRNDSKEVLQLRQNPCLIAQSPPPASEQPDYTKLDPSNAASTTYAKWYIKEDGRIESNSSSAKRSFRLVRINRQPYAGTIDQRDINDDGTIDEKDRYLSVWRDRNSTPTSGVGSVTVQVEGQSYQNGKIVSSVILERTYELTPKCCGVPFGGKHGNVDYTVQTTGESAGTTACLTQLGLGLLAGAQGTDTGAITIRGRSSDVVDDDDAPVNPIYCLASNIETGCDINNNNPSINVAIVDTELPKPYTFCTPRQGAEAYTPDNPCASTTSSGPSPGPINGNDASACDPASVSLFECKTGREIIINAGSNNYPQQYCRKTRDDLELHCNISNINASPSTTAINFITGGRKLYLYFPNSGGVINETGQAEIRNCQSFDTLSGCQPSSSTTSLSLFGSTTNEQTIRLRGTSGLSSNIFVYFPSGIVDLGGNPNFAGILWTNKLTSSGAVEWTIPKTGLTEVFDLLGLTGQRAGEIEPLFYDFVLRSTNQQRWLSG